MLRLGDSMHNHFTIARDCDRHQSLSCDDYCLSLARPVCHQTEGPLDDAAPHHMSGELQEDRLAARHDAAPAQGPGRAGVTGAGGAKCKLSPAQIRELQALLAPAVRGAHTLQTQSIDSWTIP